MGGAFIGTLGGAVATDIAGAVPIKAAGGGGKTTADGTPVNGPTAQSSLYTSALIVVGALATLLVGARVLRDARIA